MRRDLIFGPVNKLFFNKGFANVTMQMVAEELTISKKTLYKHFQNKEGLIAYILSERTKEYKSKWDNLKEGNQNIVQLSLEMRKFVTEKSNYQNQRDNLEELRALYPEIFKAYLTGLKDIIEYCIKDIVVLGQRDGLYIDYIDKTHLAKLVAFFYVESRLLRSSEFSANDIDKFTLLFYFLTIRGALTPKGQKIFEKLESEIHKLNYFDLNIE